MKRAAGLGEPPADMGSQCQPAFDVPGSSGRPWYMRIIPTISWSGNLDGAGFSHDRELVPRRAVHEPITAREA